MYRKLFTSFPVYMNIIESYHVINFGCRFQLTEMGWDKRHVRIKQKDWNRDWNKKRVVFKKNDRNESVVE